MIVFWTVILAALIIGAADIVARVVALRKRSRRAAELERMFAPPAPWDNA
jgi:hypothetical protein